jgi:hypothetical protein
VYPYALAAKNGKETFVFSRNIEDGSSSGSFLQSAHTHLQKSVYEADFGFVRRVVITKTLDSFIHSKGIVPDIIKIDVEGVAVGRRAVAVAVGRLGVAVAVPAVVVAVAAVVLRLGRARQGQAEQRDGRADEEGTHGKGILQVRV